MKASNFVSGIIVMLFTVVSNSRCQVDNLKVYYVASSRNSECPQNQSYSACNTLHVYVENSTKYFVNNSKFVFEGGHHSMESNIYLKVFATSDIILTSTEGEKAQIECKGTFSFEFYFVHVQSLVIENLIFAQCRTSSNTTSQHLAILGIVNSTDVQLKFVKVRHCQGNGLLLNNVVGRVNIYGVEVVNGTTIKNALASMYFTSCQQSSNVTITHSSFKNNRNKGKESDKDVKKSPYSGGLSLTINCSDVQVNITDVTFIGNTGNNGGNLYVSIHTHPSTTLPAEPLLTVDRCLFQRGHGLVGGGIYVSLKEYQNVSKTNQLQISNCVIPLNHTLLLVTKSNFLENGANRTGGAIFMKHKTSASNNCATKWIVIEHCNFTKNYLNDTGSGGTAISSFHFKFPGYIHHSAPQSNISISNCIFTNNYVSVRKGERDTSGSGVILAKSHRYFEIVNVTIDSNNCSGILVLDSNLVITGRVTIRNNSGYSGGGLLICQNAVLFLHPRTILNIESNQAKHSGGGILVESKCSQSKPICFYQLASLNHQDLDTVQINLINNTADYAGQQLFGGDVDFCYMIESLHDRKNNTSVSLDIYQKIFNVYPNITNGSKMLSSVTSIPRRVCSLRPEINNITCASLLPHQSKHPGETFEIQVAIVGQLEGPVPGIVVAQFENSTHGDSFGNLKSRTYQRIDSSTHKLRYTVYTNKSNVTLLMHVEQSVDDSILIHTPEVKIVKLYVHMRECPLGFELRKQMPYYCICNRIFKMSDLGIACNITNHSISRPPNSWLGFYNDGSNVILTLTKNCAFDYCITSNTWIHTYENSIIDQDDQCRYNRTGLLCGQCPHGMSIGLGGSTCLTDCSDYNLFKLILFLLLGVIFIGLLILFNITITEGYISGIIFYANIVNIHSSVFFSLSALKPLQMIISWVDLDFGISTCFYKGMDTYSKAWLQYASPVYLWILIALIIYLSRKSSKIMRLFGKNAVKVLATVVLLSYTKLIQATLISLQFHNLTTFNMSTNKTGTTRRWYADADIKYLEGKHIPLFIMGILFGALSLGFTMSLLCIQHLQKVTHLRVFFWVTKFKPFFDAYTGPFSSRGQFWTGLLLMMRLLLTVITSLNFFNADIFNIIATIPIVTVLLGLAWFVRPGIYRKQNMDLLECSFLLNLLFLCIGIVANYIAQDHKLQSEKRVDREQQMLTTILTTIAIITSTGVFMYHIWLQLRSLSCTKKILSAFKHLLVKFYCPKFMSSEVPPEDDTDFDSHFPPMARFDTDREPLLAD